MASSRIFIKGLPPTISEDDFKKHFSQKQEITDAKLLPHRRIGYVGYKTPEDAAKAVKYFNRSFIKMSKIGVEIARPISDATLPVSRKSQREQVRENAKNKRNQESVDVAPTNLLGGQKRKHSDLDESDPKLKEFLEVMQPASKSKNWATQITQDPEAEPPTKIQAMEVPEGGSDGEYEAVPKKKKKSPAPVPVVPSSVPAIVEVHETADTDKGLPLGDATDDDWMRGRTSRLLDLMDPSEIVPQKHEAASHEDADAPVEIVRDAPQATEEPSEENEAEPMNTEQESPEEQNPEEAETLDATLEAIKSNGRLFVRNLPYSATEDELRDHFRSYGKIEEIHLPLDAKGTSKGFVLVQYANPDAAAEAYHNLDGEPFQGRLLHIIPAAAKREQTLDEFAIAKLPLKKQKEIKKKAEASTSTFNWNSLFMNQDAVNTSVAERLGVSKAELLDPTSSDAGVRQALAETSVIRGAKAYFAKNGVNLDAFKQRERGDTAILVKNFSHGTTLEELRKMFEEFGQVLRVLMPPTGTIAIVEFAQPGHAKAAFANLSYRRVKDSVLFLEKAPKNTFTGVPTAQGGEHSLKIEAGANETGDEIVDTTTLFVRNLNFTTTNERLTEVFKPLAGFMSARVNTKADPKKQGQALSMGFGFLEFKTKGQAQAALTVMNGHMLDGHSLVIKASHKGADAAEERRKADRSKKIDARRTKIIIKNLPFETSKKDVRTLFGKFGQLRSVRVPKKFDHSARGFAFADFITAREAENALESLKDTHLLGRRLVLEFASDDPLDAEEEIEKMQKKVGSQVNKVALQKLTGGGRKKFNVEGDDAGDD